MKKLLVLSSLAFSLSSFAQSYLILNNGVTLTTDLSGYVYDIGHFVAPYKVTLSGGQFFAEQGKLVTVDENGYLYRKDEKAPSKINGRGSNYVIDNKGSMLTFDSKGFFYKFDKDSDLKKTKIFGGNFFTVKPDEKKLDTFLYTVNKNGNYFKLNVEGLDPASIIIPGGNFFQTITGAIYTVSSEGNVFSKSEIKTGSVSIAGGNFFVDLKNVIYTVSTDGFLYVPALPANLNVKLISKVGKNYMIDTEGRIFVVDNLGNIYEREVKHDLREAKVLSI